MPDRCDRARRADRASLLRGWLWLLPAAVTETGWIAGVRYADGSMAWGATGLAVAASLFLALKATRVWSPTTVYILFTALGTLGAFVVEQVTGEVVFSVPRLAWLLLLLVGMAGLQNSGART